MENSSIIVIVMALYLVFIILVGFIYSTRAKQSTDEFFLAGRKLGPFVTAMSAEASDMSGYLLMGLPGLAYFTGLADVTWTCIGLSLGTYLNWLFVAKRLRNYSYVANNSITLPEFITNRFHEKENSSLKIISAIFILIFFTVYVASCFVTFGKLFSIVFNTNYHSMMLIGALIVLLYTMTGGFLAVCTTDLIQAIIMIVALICVLIFGVNSANGFSNVFDNLSKIPGFLSMQFSAIPILENGVQQSGQFSSTPAPYTFLTIISTMAWGLGYFGMPQVLVRFFAIRDAKEIKLSRRVAIIWVVISMAVAVLIGLIGRVLFPDAVDLATSSLAENIFIKMSITLLPTVLCGVCLAGILAASMSSADSYLLITASSLVEDLYKSVFNKTADNKLLIKLSKIVLIFVSILSVFIAWDENSVIFTVVSFAWAGFGATFGPLMLFSLFWKRITKEGALFGMLSGGISVFIWKLIIKPMGGILSIYELLPAFIISTIFIIIVSLITKKPDDSILEEFEKVKNM